MKRTFFALLVVIVFLVSGCISNPSLVSTPQDVRYVPQLPLAELVVAVFDTEQNPLNGTIQFKELRELGGNEPPVLGNFEVTSGIGIYHGKVIKSNIPYEYRFSAKEYYPDFYVENAKIPIGTIDENVSLNWSFVFSPIKRKGNINIKVRDEYTREFKTSPIVVNVSKQFNFDFSLKMTAKKFIFQPSIMLVPVSPYDDSYYRFEKGISCLLDSEYSLHSLSEYVPEITEDKTIDCDLSLNFDNTFGVNGTRFYLYYSVNEPSDWRGKNISNIVEFKVVR